MINYFNQFGGDLMTFWRSTSFDDPKFYAYWFFPLVGVWLFAILYMKFINNKNANSLSGNTWQIIQATFYSSLLMSLILISWYTYNWTVGFYRQNRFEIAHLLSLMATLGVGFFGMVFWVKCFSTSGHPDLIGQPLTNSEKVQKLSKAKSVFSKSRMAVLLPLIGFSMLFLNFNRSYNLVAIVLDNSVSMDASLNGMDSSLEIGQAALQQTIDNFDQYTEIIITSFEKGDYKSSIKELTAVGNESQLRGVSTFFSGNEQLSCQQYISSLGIELTSSSPLCESIWKNFLHARQQSETKSYENIIQIIITDGDGRLSGDLNGFLCEAYPYQEFFSEFDQVNIINLESNDNSFMQKAQDCGYTIQYGTDKTSYHDALESIVGDYQRSHSFITAMGVLFLLFLICSLSIQPKLKLK